MSDQKTRPIEFFSKYWVFVISIIVLAFLFVTNYIIGTPEYPMLLLGGAYTMFGLGVWQIQQDRSNGTHSKAWMCFAGFAASYAIAETFWNMCSANIDNSCAIAKTILNVGFIPQIAFAVLYIKPFFDSISKNNIIIALLTSVLILIPSLYFIIQFDAITDEPDILSVYTFTIFDSILVIPMVIGFGLFVGGRVNFTWSLIFFAVLSMTIADFMFITAMLNGSQFFDEWQNIFYVIGYTFYSLGLYYKSRKYTSKNAFYNQESMR